MKQLFLALLFISILYSCNTGSSEPASGNLKIVYNVLLTKSCDNYEVFIMNTDGTGKKNISNWKGSDWAYGTYKDKIYFVSDRDTTGRMWFLYEMDAEGNNVRKISNIRLQDSYISTRNNGKEIIICPYDKNNSYFLVMNVSDGKIIDTINIPFANIGDPCFSPDGSQIVFRGAEEKKRIDELYIINADETGLRQLTHYPGNDSTAQWYEYHAGPPVWEHNTNIISYISKQNNNHSIYTIKPGGTELKKLTDDKMNEGWHSWSPDAKHIVFDGSDLQDKNFDIYIMNSNGTQTKRLTNDTLVEQGPLFINW